MMKYILLITGFILMMNPLKAQDLSELYSKVNPAVVTIKVKEKQYVGSGPRKQAIMSGGLGSGFLINNQRVITAAHVVQTAEDIIVEVNNGEEIPAKVISTYQNADVAMLELVWPTKENTHLALGDSDAMKIGERVFVIGAPFGLEHSLSSGYISNKMTSNTLSTAFTELEFFQTDASINHGNSGGPMLNLKGEVIGIVSYILSQSGGFEGLGFVATSNVARDLLIERKSFYLGISSDILEGNMARLLNVPQKYGLLIKKVVDLSPAGMAGLKGGTYNVEIDGEQVTLGGDIVLAVNEIEFSPENLGKIAELMEGINDGDTLKFKVLRGGQILDLSWLVTGRE